MANSVVPDASPLVHERALELLDEIGIAGKKVVDLGAGSGAFTEKLLLRGAAYVVALDIDASRFGLLGSPLVDFVIADLETGIPLRDEGFQVAVAIEVIEHLFNVKSFIEEIHRILKRNGVLVLTTPNVEHLLSRIYFLFSGRLWHFFRGSDWKHVTPIFSWKLRQLVRGLFVVERVSLNRPVSWPLIPGLRGKPLLPLRNPGRLLGEIWVYRLRKK